MELANLIGGPQPPKTAKIGEKRSKKRQSRPASTKLKYPKFTFFYPSAKDNQNMKQGGPSGMAILTKGQFPCYYGLYLSPERALS